MDIKEIRYFSASTPPGCPGENLQAQKWSFWMVSVEFDHRLPAELPLTAENHWFPPRFNLNQILDPHGEISGFGIEKSCFSQVDPLWMSSEHSWGPEITRISPGKVSETIWYHGSGWDPHNPEISNPFFFVQQKPDLYISFTSPLRGILLRNMSDLTNRPKRTDRCSLRTCAESTSLTSLMSLRSASTGIFSSEPQGKALAVDLRHRSSQVARG